MTKLNTSVNRIWQTRVINLAVTALVSISAPAWAQEELTGCLKKNGKIVRVQEGNSPKKACKNKQTQIMWPGTDKTDALTATDTSLQNQINSLDDSLQNQIDDLVAADDSLQTQIDDLKAGTPTQVTVNCASESLQAAIDVATPRTTILVEGTCNENILIAASKQQITIDGQGSASITGVAGMSTIRILGKGITIRNFNGDSITGNGEDTVIIVVGAASATIDRNTISGGSNGVVISRVAEATVVNNTIQNNSAAGVVVTETSDARVGFSAVSQTVAEPNTIQNNGTYGVLVSRNSMGRIVGNMIVGNGNDGVGVFDSSVGEISDNTINSNGDNGIQVGRVSSARLGSATGDTIFTRPNQTTGGNDNADFGLDCFGNSSVDGRVGTLNGVNGDRDIPTGNSGCFDNLAD